MIKRRFRALLFLLFTAGPASAQLGPPPLTGLTVQPQGASAARPLAQKLSDQLSLLDFGAACDGKTDDSNAVTAAGQSGRRVIVPGGMVCNAPHVPQATMQGVFIGGGQVKGSDGNPRGPQFGAVRSAPNPQVWDPVKDAAGQNGENDCASGFPCWAMYDYSHTLSAEEYHISGAATLGTPIHNYEGMPGVNAHTLLIDNASGWNHSHNSNDGRTGASAYSTVLQNRGGGDFGVFGAHIQCVGTVGPGDGNPVGQNDTGVRAALGNINGYTDWLAVPNCGFLGADFDALAPAQYMQLGEYSFIDHGNDVSAIGNVHGYNRTSVTTLLNNRWIDELATCNAGFTGTPCDAWTQIGGQWNIGLDLIGVTGKATIAQAANQRITLNGSDGDPTGEANPRLANLGNDWITDDGTGIVLAQNGAAAVRVSNPANPTSFWQISGAQPVAQGGYTVNLLADGSDPGIGAVLGDKGGAGVLIRSNGSNVGRFISSVGSTAYLNVISGTPTSPLMIQTYAGTNMDLALAAAGTGLVRIAGAVPPATDTSTAVATTAFVQSSARSAVSAMIGNREKIVNVGPGANITLAPPPGVVDQMIVEIEPSQATISTMALTMPATTAIPDGFIVHLVSSGTVTSLTMAANTGQTMAGAPASIAPTSPYAFMWDATLSQWLPFR